MKNMGLHHWGLGEHGSPLLGSQRTRLSTAHTVLRPSPRSVSNPDAGILAPAIAATYPTALVISTQGYYFSLSLLNLANRFFIFLDYGKKLLCQLMKETTENNWHQAKEEDTCCRAQLEPTRGSVPSSPSTLTAEMIYFLGKQTYE